MSENKHTDSEQKVDEPRKIRKMRVVVPKKDMIPMDREDFEILSEIVMLAYKKNPYDPDIWRIQAWLESMDIPTGWDENLAMAKAIMNKPDVVPKDQERTDGSDGTLRKYMQEPFEEVDVPNEEERTPTPSEEDAYALHIIDTYSPKVLESIIRQASKTPPPGPTPQPPSEIAKVIRYDIFCDKGSLDVSEGENGTWVKYEDIGMAVSTPPVVPKDDDEAENAPCCSCGRTDLPLHTNYLCPECASKIADILEKRLKDQAYLYYADIHKRDPPPEPTPPNSHSKGDTGITAVVMKDADGFAVPTGKLPDVVPKFSESDIGRFIGDSKVKFTFSQFCVSGLVPKYAPRCECYRCRKERGEQPDEALAEQVSELASQKFKADIPRVAKVVPKPEERTPEWTKQAEDDEGIAFYSDTWICDDGDHAQLEVYYKEFDRYFKLSCFGGSMGSDITMHETDLPDAPEMNMRFQGGTESDWIKHCKKVAEWICSKFCRTKEQYDAQSAEIMTKLEAKERDEKYKAKALEAGLSAEDFEKAEKEHAEFLKALNIPYQPGDPRPSDETVKQHLEWVKNLQEEHQ